MGAENELEENESDEGGGQKGCCEMRIGDMETEWVDEIKYDDQQ